MEEDNTPVEATGGESTEPTEAPVTTPDAPAEEAAPEVEAQQNAEAEITPNVPENEEEAGA